MSQDTEKKLTESEETQVNKRIEPQSILMALLVLMFCVVLVLNAWFMYRQDIQATFMRAQMELEIIAGQFEARFAQSETLALNIVLDIEQLAEEGATDDEYQAYLDEMSQIAIEQTDGCCFNIYSGDTTHILSSPLPFPDDFVPTSRGWYIGAVENNGELYQTPIYDDIVTGDLCYTFSMQLYDRETVVGVDFNMDWISETIEHMQEYIKGEALIVTDDGRIVGYSDMSYVGEDVAVVLPDYKNAIKIFEKNGTDSAVTIDTDDGERTFLFTDTGNSCYLMVSVDKSALNQNTYRHMIIVSVLSVTVLIAFIVIYLYAIRKKRAAEDALVRMEKANSLVGGLSKKAYQDALTGVRNKRAYVEDTQDMGSEPFAIVMFDVNYLKLINDKYGHEKGDIYLKNACSIICKVYKHCPVFRVGGDEFVSILRGEYVEKGAELFNRMDEEVEAHNAEVENPWEKVNVAKGMAAYDPERDADMDNPVDVIYTRADEAMYIDKAEKKRK